MLIASSRSLPAALHIVAILLYSFCLSGYSSATENQQISLPAPVIHALRSAQIPQEAIAIWVQNTRNSTPQLAIHENTPMNPASVMKLVTAFAALEQLGPTYAWQTKVSITGTIEENTLNGNLYLIGTGDPILSYERLWKLLRRIRTLTGIERINGNIITDTSALLLPPHDPAAFDNRGIRPYNAGPHGLLLEHNTVKLILIPGKQPGTPITVISDPELPGLTIDNQIRTVKGACSIWYRNLDAKLETESHLILTGTLPSSCGRRDWGVSPLSPERYSNTLIAALWSEVGGRLNGQVRNGITPKEATFLLADTSPPLGNIVRDMNKWSNNLIARQLLITLGRVTPQNNVSDMVQGGEQVALKALTKAGIETNGLVIDNGSGLSRNARIRADTLGQMLIIAWRRPWMAEFISSMPTAGVDGTARHRLNSSPAKGQAHIKTGSLNNVRAIAGYVLDRHGDRMAVVMMINHPRAIYAQAAQDALLEWVWSAPFKASTSQDAIPKPPKPSAKHDG